MSHHWGWTNVDDPRDADLIVFNGGEDIGSSIYDEPSVSWGNAKVSPRDEHEIAIYNKYQGDKFMLGICRGGQLLNCLNGGSLWQDVNHHGMNHLMYDKLTGETLEVTSTHHQMMIPDNDKGIVIGVSSESTYKKNAAGKVSLRTTREIKNGDDVEIVWYPNSRSLCIQGHPEYVPGSRFADYSRDLILSLYDKGAKRSAA